ncbi:hypothetical protein B1992_08880 [Pseudoxanthomonas broegbernensis]|uniref:DUF1269 domain-containing protein n=2 Tax=Pseudoxanthomonas broegbernensis TaxID=83619 RepID=A0A7V8GMA3_9GAMM|nr:hypothetical protein B1992_08880 [Pseudoxanthomonas broegbernensis]
MAQAHRAVRAALAHGTPDDDIHVVARSDIEARQIHDRRKMADSDFIPAALRGVAGGGILGLAASLIVMAVHGAGPLAVLLGTGVGAAIGGLAASLMGAGVQDPVRRRFEKQIDAGNILILIDEDDTMLPETLRAMEEAGAKRLPYDAPSAMS